MWCNVCGGSVEQLPFRESFDFVAAITVLSFVAGCGRRSSRDGPRAATWWASCRRVHGWLGSSTWAAARFRTAVELRFLADQGVIHAAADYADRKPRCRGVAYVEFAELEDGVVTLTAAGRVFAQSSTEELKRLFREH